MKRLIAWPIVRLMKTTEAAPSSRIVVLDTETTGINVRDGHRIIEIGCVEIIHRRITGHRFHCYLNPGRKVDQGAFEVHGLSDEFLSDKPAFADIADDFLAFLGQDEVVIHNAPFDTGFINAELAALSGKSRLSGIESICVITDSLDMARKKHPGQRNNLDSLCRRYGIDNSNRDLHGALLDAELLAQVYLAMTGGQSDFLSSAEVMPQEAGELVTRETVTTISFKRPDDAVFRIIQAAPDELDAHLLRLQAINKSSGQQCLWLNASEPLA